MQLNLRSREAVSLVFLVGNIFVASCKCRRASEQTRSIAANDITKRTSPNSNSGRYLYGGIIAIASSIEQQGRTCARWLPGKGFLLP